MLLVRFPGVAQLVARLLWEQDAASSSLATWTKNKREAFASLLFFETGKRLEESNAVRMSAAGDGLTEPNRYLHHRCRCKRVSPLGPKEGMAFAIPSLCFRY